MSTFFYFDPGSIFAEISKQNSKHGSKSKKVSHKNGGPDIFLAFTNNRLRIT